MMRPLLRLLAAGPLCAAALLALPAPASGATCGDRETAAPFAAWGDRKAYFLVANGGFELGSVGWKLGGGAEVVAGNEPFYVRSTTDRQSLLIPTGGWAETQPFCVDSDEPTLRYFVRNTGSVLSTLSVSVTIRTTALGIATETTLPLGLAPGTTVTWQPSLTVVIGLSPNQLLGGTTMVRFRFTPLLAGGKWQIDDVYVDPFKDW